MMPDLARIYDRAFFAEHGATNEPYIATARWIVGDLSRRFAPARVIDLGCGCGIFAHAFRERGAEVVAVDGALAPPEFAFPGPVEARDLTVPFANPWGRFDLALCLEVAEHIPEELSDAFLANIVQFSDRLIFSAARPYQGGTHHVNERPKRYWWARLAAHGFAYDRKRTGEFSERFLADRPPFMWMCQSISVFERVTSRG